MDQVSPTHPLGQSLVSGPARPPSCSVTEGGAGPADGQADRRLELCKPLTRILVLGGERPGAEAREHEQLQLQGGQRGGSRRLWCSIPRGAHELLSLLVRGVTGTGQTSECKCTVVASGLGSNPALPLPVCTLSVSLPVTGAPAGVPGKEGSGPGSGPGSGSGSGVCSAPGTQCPLPRAHQKSPRGRGGDGYPPPPPWSP